MNVIVKDSILLLCNIMNKLQSESLLSIHFKNGQGNLSCDNTISTFWKCMHNLLCPLLECEDILKCVKINLARRGYNGIIFYTLPSDGLGGSRELLLALSWLIANGIIEEKMDNIVKESMSIQEFLDSEIEIPKINENISSYTSVDWCKHILHKAGCIKFYHRRLADLYSERSILLHKLHKEFADELGGSQLSVLEATVISYQKELLPKYTKYISLFNSLIESYVLWKGKEKVYFEWVQIVLHEKINKDKKLLNKSMINNAVNFKAILCEEIKKNNSVSQESEVVHQYEHLEECDYYKKCLKSLNSILKSFNLRVVKRN